MVGWYWDVANKGSEEGEDCNSWPCCSWDDVSNSGTAWCSEMADAETTASARPGEAPTTMPCWGEWQLHWPGTLCSAPGGEARKTWEVLEETGAICRTGDEEGS